MEETSLVDIALENVRNSEKAYCKFLSANDSGETGGHQSGVLITNNASEMLFTQSLDELKALPEPEKRPIRIKWQGDINTHAVATFYPSKKEMRITAFKREFPYLTPDMTGALFVMTESRFDDYRIVLLTTEDDINRFLDSVNLSPTETGRMFSARMPVIGSDIIESNRINRFIDDLIEPDSSVAFPDSDTMSAVARDIYHAAHDPRHRMFYDVDELLLEYTDQEFRIFRTLEWRAYGTRLGTQFYSVDEFVSLANEILNRRKSRAGKSLEHHTAAILRMSGVQYEEQVRTEGNKKPDFIFPSGEAYHTPWFPDNKLVMLAAKTTCKDRWRQVLNEADRFRDRPKYLLTLQQGISAPQMDEMNNEGIVLVVPERYHQQYPKQYRERLLTLRNFIEYVQTTQA